MGISSVPDGTVFTAFGSGAALTGAAFNPTLPAVTRQNAESKMLRDLSVFVAKTKITPRVGLASRAFLLLP